MLSNGKEEVSYLGACDLNTKGTPCWIQKMGLYKQLRIVSVKETSFWDREEGKSSLISIFFVRFKARCFVFRNV